jgi:hypothetical protein
VTEEEGVIGSVVSASLWPVALRELLLGGGPRHTRSGGRVSHPVLRPNRMLIVCVPRTQVYTNTI